MEISLTNPTIAYTYGFSLADGHLSSQSRNRGKLSIEIHEKDLDILEKIRDSCGVKATISKRSRATNFGEATFYCLNIFDRSFRESFSNWGFPVGRKSNKVSAPDVDYSDRDFFRGVIDGDGSIGLTGSGIPYISLVTVSESLKDDFLNLILKLTGKQKTLARNARDSAYNIMVTKEDAVRLAEYLYYDGCLALDRKMIKSEDVKSWIRPEGMKVVTSSRWTDEQDEIVLSNSVEEAARILGRTKSSVANRRFRLRKR